MKIGKRSVNLIIISLYLITLLLGTDVLVHSNNINTLKSYLLIIVPFTLCASIFLDNFKTKIKLKKIPLVLSTITIAFMILTMFFGIKTGIESLKGLINFTLLLVLGNFLINVNITEYQKYRIKKHFYITFLICVLYGIIQYIFKIDINIFSNEIYPGINGRINSTFFIATLLDKYIVLSLIILSYDLIKNRSNIFMNLLFILGTISLYFTFSRSGILLYFLALVIFLIISFMKKNILNLITIFLSLVLIFVLPGVKYSVQSGFDYVYDTLHFPNGLRIDITDLLNNNDKEPIKNESVQYREYYKSIGEAFIKEYPIFGIGIGNYSYLYNTQSAEDYLKDTSVLDENIPYMYPHSSYVQVGAEVGIVGLILIYVTLISFIIPFNKKKTYIIGLILFALLFGSLTETLLHAKQYIYIFIILYSLICNETKINFINKKRKKITFLSFHLGYGGIETSTINTVNALSNKYDVEVISFYKLKDSQANNLNKNIKVKYLYNGGPNKEEFLKSLKSFNIPSLIKNTFIACDILNKKRSLIIKEILLSDSDVIVSTRSEFSVLLSAYGKSDTLKIAQEHQHHNNDKKYINTISYKYDNIDYLFALTDSLKQDYEKFLIKNKSTKVIVVPNMIYSFPKKLSNLNKNNLITIGRLEKLKRNDEIINIVGKLKNKSNLYIIGNGSECNNLIEQTKSMGLSNRVIFTGYKNNIEKEEYLLNSSVFLLASETEGLPMVLLEAMSYGIPCIAYETDSGVRDIIDDNVNGFIIKRDNQKDYIEKLELLVSDLKLRKSFSKFALEKSKKFSKEEILKKWESVLGD